MKSCLALIVGLVSLTGCGLEKSVDMATDFGRSVAIAAIEKAPPLQSLAASGTATIANPKYRIMAGLFNGIVAEIGLEGIVVTANLQGAGTGEGGAPSGASTDVLGSDSADDFIRGVLEGIRAAQQDAIK